VEIVLLNCQVFIGSRWLLELLESFTTYRYS